MKPNKNKGKTQFVGFVGFVGPIDHNTPIDPPKRSIETLQDQNITDEYTHTHISSLFLLGFMVVNSSVKWSPTNSDVTDESKIRHTDSTTERTHHAKRTRNAIRRILAVGGVVVPWRRFACVYGAILEAWGHAGRGVGQMWCHFGTRPIGNSCVGGVELWDVRQGETGPDRWRDKTVPFAVQSCPKLLPKNVRKILLVGLAVPIDNVRMIHVRQGNQLQQETRR